MMKFLYNVIRNPLNLKSKYLPYLLFILSWILVVFLLYYKVVPTYIFPDYLVQEKEKIVEKELIKIEEVIKKDKIPLRKFVTYYNPKIDPSIAYQIEVAVEKYAKKYKLPKKLIMGIIKKESTFYPLAHSNVAGGLMQVYPKFHKDKIEAMGIKDTREIFYIDNNIHLGCWIFSEYLNKENGNLDKAFHRYLSRNASKKEKREYINSILLAWANMEIMEKEK